MFCGCSRAALSWRHLIARLIAPLCLALSALSLLPAHARAQTGRVACERCHANREFLAGKGGSAEADLALFVPDSILHISSHDTLSCTSCHQDYDDAFPHQPRAQTVECRACHEPQADAWNRSIHAPNFATERDAPTCTDCHDAHLVLGQSERASPIHPLNEAGLCASCHADERIIETYFTDPADSVARIAVEQYHETVHGTALRESGLIVTATCSDCHGAHRILPSDSTASTISRDSIPATCGKCHVGVSDRWLGSAHGAAFTHQDTVATGHAAPVCNDCHDAHGVVAPNELWRSAVVEECGVCHQALFESYLETYHGKVTRLGSTIAARCSDCHSPHENLPPDNPASTVHALNLVDTCGRCHERATASFVQYHPHGDHHDRERFPEMYFTWLLMTSLLIGVFAFFGLHTGLWLLRNLLGERTAQRQTPPAPPPPDPVPPAADAGDPPDHPAARDEGGPDEETSDGARER